MSFRFNLFASSAQDQIESENIILRAPRLRDWRQWANLRAESRNFLTPWEPLWPQDALSFVAYRRWQSQMATDWRLGRNYAFFIIRKLDDQLLGGVTLSHVRRGVAQMASLGYWIGSTFARQGYMTRAIELVIPFAFQRLKIHRIEAACLPRNVASHGLLRKTGFIEEGLARRYLLINGVWEDHLLFALLADDDDKRKHQLGQPTSE